MYKVDENPVCRFPENQPFEQELGHWAIAKLRSRREKIFACQLKESGIAYYLPMFVKRVSRRDNGKIRKSVLPLISGYIAVSLKSGIPKTIYQGDHVMGLIRVKNQERLIEELNTINYLLNQDVYLNVQMGILPGRPIVIRSGPFRGVEGIIKKKCKEHYLHVNLEMFGRTVSVKMDSADVNPRPVTSSVDWIAT